MASQIPHKKSQRRFSRVRMKSPYGAPPTFPAEGALADREKPTGCGACPLCAGPWQIALSPMIIADGRQESARSLWGQSGRRRVDASLDRLLTYEGIPPRFPAVPGSLLGTAHGYPAGLVA